MDPVAAAERHPNVGNKLADHLGGRAPLDVLATMLTIEAGHDLSHIDQLHRYPAAIDEGKREM